MSTYTRFRYIFHQEVPIITAVFGFRSLVDRDGNRVRTELYFAVDTAAKASIITPPGEAKLRNEFPSVQWDKQFRHGLMYETIVGKVPFKAADNVYVEFLAENGNTWKLELPFILFCENFKQPGIQFQAGHHLPYCLLGQDVLRRCGMLATKDHGLISPDQKAVDSLIAAF